VQRPDGARPLVASRPAHLGCPARPCMHVSRVYMLCCPHVPVAPPHPATGSRPCTPACTPTSICPAHPPPWGIHVHGRLYNRSTEDRSARRLIANESSFPHFVLAYGVLQCRAERGTHNNKPQLYHNPLRCQPARGSPRPRPRTHPWQHLCWRGSCARMGAGNSSVTAASGRSSLGAFALWWGEAVKLTRRGERQ
jgi:hypothetical protein